MARIFVRKMLRNVGLLDSARRLKQRLTRYHPTMEFKPADPRLLTSTLRCFQWLLENNLAEGSDYLEFGIFRGFNLWYSQSLARAFGVKDMRFFGFDSFFGIPPVNGIDAGGAFREGDFSAYKDDVHAALTRFGVDWNNTFLIEGFFENSLNQATIKQYALRRSSFCVVDCDLYSSTVTVLNFIAPLLGDPCLLYFDDWADYGPDQSKGEPRAFAEFLERNAHVFDVEPFIDFRAIGGKGKAFVLHRKQA
jgi:O-methyltransferase